MFRILTVSFFGFILSIFFTSCIDLDGDSNDDTSGSPKPQLQEVTVTGIVKTDSSLVSQEIFNISANVIGADNKTISKASTVSIVNEQFPDINGMFSFKVKAAKGNKIVISAYAPGYTRANQTVYYKGGNEINVVLNARSLITGTVDINQGIVITSAGKKFVRIAITKDKDTGSNIIKTGIEAQGSSEEKIIDLAIPVSSLQSNVQQLNLGYRSYSPSNPEDYEEFPGVETTNNNKLVSFGFDYLQITDQEGNNPFISSNGIKAQLVSGEYLRVLRKIDCKQINNLKNAGIIVDEDPDKPGIQFTFYGFDLNSGMWLEAGQGTFVEDRISNFTNSEWDTIITAGCNPNSTSTNPNDGDAGCSEYGIIMDLDNLCDNGDLDYVVISNRNPELDWVNLDYIIPRGSELSCTIKLVDENKNPVSGTFISARSECLARISGNTDSNGEVILSSIGFSDPCTVNIDIHTKDFGYIYTSASFTGDNSCYEEIQINDPYKCKVEGTVVDENGKPVADVVVVTFPLNSIRPSLEDGVPDIFHMVGITDKNGNFSIKTGCNRDMYVMPSTSRNEYKEYNINGNIDFDETEDNGTVVNVGNITLYNEYPIGRIRNFSEANIGLPLTVELCGYDYEGFYPITYTLYISKNNSTFKTFTGTIGKDERCVYHTFTPDTEGVYIAYAELEDSKGKKGPSMRDAIVYISDSHYIKGSIEVDVSENTGYPFREEIIPTALMYTEYIIIYAHGHFEDSDNTHSISSSLTVNCYDKDNNIQFSDTKNGTKHIYLEYDYTLNTTPRIEYCKFNLLVTDGINSIEHIKTVPTRK